MYSLILSIHNLFRWIALVLGLGAAFRSFQGMSGQKEWTDLDQRWGMLFASALDIQLLLGVALYFFLSPITQGMITKFTLAFEDSTQQFYSIFHVAYMLLAILFAHLGSILPRTAPSALVKYQRSAAFFTLAILCILLGMPWSRPIFPGL